MHPTLTVVIATYNRPELVKRAIASAAPQADEVIVVNDGSSVAYDLNAILAEHSNVRYIALEKNRGVQFARNAGLDAAKTDLALVLDDDDTMRDGACEAVRSTLGGFADLERYPVYNFGTSNSGLTAPFAVITHADYLNGSLSGDFTPVFNRKHAERARYPQLPIRVGVEHLLWWPLAAKYGIPSWRDITAVAVGSDADTRLTSPDTFIRRSEDFATMQNLTMRMMKKNGWDTAYPAAYRKRVFAALLFALAANDRQRLVEAVSELPAQQKWLGSVSKVTPPLLGRAALYVTKRVALRKSHKA